MHDDSLREALRALPRERASAGFTAGVLRRLEPQATRRGPLWLALAALLAVTLIGGVLAHREIESRRAVASAERLLALQAEHRQLSQELAELAVLARQARPVLHLGGDEQVDLVLDLGRLQELRSGRQESSILFAHDGGAAGGGPQTAVERGDRLF